MIRARPHWAALACAFWLLGFDVVPLLHMVLHDALDGHAHGHHGYHAHDDGDDAPPPAQHGEGSVAHRDLAAHVPLPVVPPILEALLAARSPQVLLHDERPADRRPRTTRARAPPGLAA